MLVRAWMYGALALTVFHVIRGVLANVDGNVRDVIRESNRRSEMHSQKNAVRVRSAGNRSRAPAASPSSAAPDCTGDGGNEAPPIFNPNDSIEDTSVA